MTRDEIVTILEMRLGDMQGKREHIIAELQLAQEDAEDNLPEIPWFLVNRVSTPLEVAADSQEINLALVSHFKDWETGGIFIEQDDGTYARLQKVDTKLQKGFDAATVVVEAGVPTCYWIVGSKAYLDAKLETATNFTFINYKRDESLVSNKTNLWTTHASRFLLNKAGLNIANFLQKDAATIQLFAAELMKAEQELEDESLRRKEEGDL